MLSESTRGNYRSRLRKLFKVLPHVVDEGERMLIAKEITLLEQKLGVRAEQIANKKAGRPKTRVDVSSYNKELIEESLGTPEIETSAQGLERIIELANQERATLTSPNSISQHKKMIRGVISQMTYMTDGEAKENLRQEALRLNERLPLSDRLDSEITEAGMWSKDAQNKQARENLEKFGHKEEDV